MEHFVITVARETGSGGHERLFGAADECIGWKEMLSTAEKVYTGEEWRDAAGYDLSLDSEQLGEDGCVELIRKILLLFT